MKDEERSELCDNVSRALPEVARGKPRKTAARKLSLPLLVVE
jgi:hypothetical protein